MYPVNYEQEQVIRQCWTILHTAKEDRKVNRRKWVITSQKKKVNLINKRGQSVQDPVCSIHTATFVKNGRLNWSSPPRNYNLSCKYYFVFYLFAMRHKNISFSLSNLQMTVAQRPAPREKKESANATQMEKARSACNLTAKQKQTSVATHSLDEIKTITESKPKTRCFSKVFEHRSSWRLYLAAQFRLCGAGRCW